MFIAESPKVIERALDAGYEPVSFLVEKRQIEGEAKEILARCPKIPVYTAQFDVLTQLTGFKLTRGMLCLMRRKPLLDLRIKGVRYMEFFLNNVKILLKLDKSEFMVPVPL